jgi:hypothetical protein
MYCPRCGVEYCDGLADCSECHVALVPEVLSKAVPVFESNDRIAISLAKGLLEDSGIPFWMQSNETASHLALVPVLFPSCHFLVPKNREVEARELLGSLALPE